MRSPGFIKKTWHSRRILLLQSTVIFIFLSTRGRHAWSLVLQSVVTLHQNQKSSPPSFSKNNPFQIGSRNRMVPVTASGRIIVCGDGGSSVALLSSSSSSIQGGQDNDVVDNGDAGDNDNNDDNDGNYYTVRQDDLISTDHADRGIQSVDKEGMQQQLEVPLAQGKNLQQTIRGGPSMIFAMARRMLVWDDEDYQAGRVLNDASNKPRAKVKVLPRWHPHDGIADANPNFRTQSPVMNNKGYGATIQRNSRKNNKPGLWRHAYRTYVKMRDIELEQQQQQLQRQIQIQREELQGRNEREQSLDKNLEEEEDNRKLLDVTKKSSSTLSGNDARYRYPSKVKIKRENRHFQAALVACAKLGLWREAIFILNEMEEVLQEDPSFANNPKKAVTINEYVILSVVKACIRGMKNRLKKDGYHKKQNGQESCRESLDSARDILFSIKQRYNISPSPMLVNPLSSAYQYLGLYLDAEQVLNYFLLQMPNMGKKETQERNLLENTAATYLTEGIKDLSDIMSTNETTTAAITTTPPPPPPLPSLMTSSHCKDDASYNILIKNSVLQGNWASAIHGLQEMTNAGYYPKSKNLNAWSEAAMKRERRPKKPTWIKQRERILTRNALSDD
jgi:hypothetical protein